MKLFDTHLRFSSIHQFSGLFFAALGLLVSSLSACSPATYGKGESITEPQLVQSEFVTADNLVLPTKVWRSDNSVPKAIIVALHGFNDYANAFEGPGQYLAEKYNIAVYAFDQRGFGQAGKRGTWAGTDTYIEDLRDFCQSIRQKYPRLPVYVLGESMGGAITMAAFTSENRPDADGAILVAPAVWARSTMPWYQRTALFVGAHLFPWASFTGEGVVKITPSDNRDMLIALGQDPLVIKDTKVSAMYGLTNLMDEALASSAAFNVPSLVMIGDLDEVVPNHPSALMVEQLPEAIDNRKIVVYKNGYHMLLRDLQAQIVWDDIAAWIENPQQELPSHANQTDLDQWLKENL